MIVKKVLASKTAGPKSVAANVRDLADYIASPTAGGDGEKVEHRGALNFLNIGHDGQVQEMIGLAETARRDAKPVQHWILSWREGEQPTAAQADDAARVFLAEMGLTEHQVIYALHSDTDNWHLHMAVNRVHPEMERVVTVNKGYDLKVAHRALARIEQRQGWQSEGRALYAPGQDGELTLVRGTGPAARQPSARALSFEERVGARSAERIAIEDAAPVIRAARTWSEVHEGLAKVGVRFEQKGSGAVLWIGGEPVKASAAGRDCSMAALQNRLGAFEPAPRLSAVGPTKARPLDRAVPLLPSYLEGRESYYRERAAARTGMRDKHRNEWRDLATRHQRERGELFRGSWRGKGVALNALRSVTAARQAQDKAALREKQQLERATLGREQGPFPTYEQWLATRDRDAAQEWRHRVRHPATIEGGTHEQPTVRDIRDFRARIDGLRVNYFGEGARDRPAFTDSGRRIEIFNSRDRTSVLAALQLSAEKWRTFVVTGDERYKQLCVQLAAEHGFKIANPELTAALAAERERLRQVRLSVSRAHGIEHRPRTPTPEAIYGRHLAEVSAQHRGKAVDPSRLDAQVAVRLAVTGHSPEQIAETIKNGACRARPSEQRDWDAYGRRAAEFALSPPGCELQERLADRQQRFLRLEGREDENALLRRLGGPLRNL